MVHPMRDFLVLASHLIVTLAKLLRPGGTNVVVAESLVLKQQLIISNRSRGRAPYLTSCYRFLIGLSTLFVREKRILKLGVAVRPATLLRFYKALVQRKYRLLLASSGLRRRPASVLRFANSLRNLPTAVAVEGLKCDVNFVRALL